MSLIDLVAARRFPAVPILLLTALAGSLTVVSDAVRPAPGGDVAPSTTLATDRPVVPSTRDAARHVPVSESYGRLPLSFEANHGQIDSRVDFLARGVGYTLFTHATEAVLMLQRPRSSPEPSQADPQPSGSDSTARQGAVLRMRLVGANTRASVAGRDRLAGIVNHFIGNDPRRWRTNIPTYSRVEYGNVYRGIDIVYYGNQQQLEYDFIVRPGADAAQIALRFAGADSVALDRDGPRSTA